jgi:hypothetical protein
VAWSSQLGGAPKFIAGGAKLIPDPRVRHYWDGERILGRAYRSMRAGGDTFHLDDDAWDIYLLFDRDAKWTAEGPPEPVWWEHQLHGLPEARYLDPERFAAKAAELDQKRATKNDG